MKIFSCPWCGEEYSDWWLENEFKISTAEEIIRFDCEDCDNPVSILAKTEVRFSDFKKDENNHENN